MAQANILINSDRRACLTDFGLSTIVYVPPRTSPNTPLSIEVPRASTGSQVSLVPHSSGGTPRWMSPELLNPEQFGLDSSCPTKQSDCYGLGMVVYEVCRHLIVVEFLGVTRHHQVLCGRVPYWEHHNKGAIMGAIIRGVRPSKPDAGETLGFTDDLWWTVESCWMMDPNIRPDVGAVLSQLIHAAWAWGRRL